MEDSVVETEVLARRKEKKKDDLGREIVYPKPIIPRKFNGLWGHQCEKCGRVLSTKKFLNRHMANHNEKETNSDEVQEYEVENQDVVVPPVRKKRASSPSCVFCSKVFSRKSHLDNHLRSHINERPFWCPHLNCEQDFVNETVLQNHLATHSNKRPYKCSDCEMSFKTAKVLNEHKKRIHLNTSLKHECESCSATFVRQHDLNEHLETHMDPLDRRSFQCLIYERRFTSKCHIRRHMKHLHNKEKPLHKCLYCFRNFFSEDDLQKHKQKEGHDREKQFSCAMCDVKFHSLKNLNGHLKTERHRIVEEDHNDAEKLVVQQVLAEENRVLVPKICCKSCTSTFPSEQELAQHVNIVHDLPEERFFSCKVEGCDKAFKWKSDLKRHDDAVHLKLRKYLCSQCGKTFKDGTNLKRHNGRHPDCDIVIRDEQSKHRGNKSERGGKMKNKKHSVNLKIKRAAKRSELKGNKFLQKTRISARLQNKEEVGK